MKVRTTEALHDLADRAADEERIHTSALIRKAVGEYVDRHHHDLGRQAA